MHREHVGVAQPRLVMSGHRRLSFRAMFGAALALGLCALHGCMVGPNYRTQDPALPAQWYGSATAPASQPASQPASGHSTQPAATLPQLSPAQLARWWEAFNDPTLSSLVERAVKSNLDLQLAQSRLVQARAARWIAADALRELQRA